MAEQPRKITREELYDRVWKTTLKRTAEELGIKYVELVDICEKLRVPRPPHGHWQRLQLGLPVEQIPLPEAAPDIPVETMVGLKKERRVINKVVSTESTEQKVTEPSLLTENIQASATAALESAQVPKSNVTQLPKATAAILNHIRQVSSIDFWVDSLDFDLSESGLATLLGLPSDHRRSAKSLIATLMEANADFTSFVVDARTGMTREPNSLRISIQVKDGFEWHNVWEEAWKFATAPNPHFLTDNALKLLQWVRSNKNTGEPTEQNRIGRQAYLRGSYHHIGDLFKEIQAKVQPRLVVEGERWGPFKVYFSKDQPKYFQVGPLNPPLKLSVKEVTHEELLRFRTWLYAELQQLNLPRGDEMVGIFHFSDRRMAKACFSDWPVGFCWDSKIREFFDALKLMEGIFLEYQFESGPGPWLVRCSLSEGWKWSRVKEWLREQQSAIPLRKKYGLSEHSAALLEWIAELRPEEYLGNLTPVVEDHLDVDMGIRTEWSHDNLPAYLAMLVDEINDKTDFDLRLQPWHEYSKVATRIRVKKKPAEMEAVIRTVQLLGLSQNKVLDADRIKAALNELLSN